MAQVYEIQAKMDQFIDQLAEEKTLRQHYQTKNSEFETEINRLVAENVQQNERHDRMQTQIQQLIDQSTKQEEEIRFLKKRNVDNIEIESNKLKNSKSSNKNDAKSESSPRLPPSSCRQLSTIGHYLDGIYLVANPETNKIETVYCEFGSSTRKYMLQIVYDCSTVFKLLNFQILQIVSETLFGSLEVKSQPVIFFVQRSSNFALTNVVLPFEREILNVGGAMNTAEGVFTAPVRSCKWNLSLRVLWNERYCRSSLYFC